MPASIPGQTDLLLAFFWAIGAVLAVLRTAAPPGSAAPTLAASLTMLRHKQHRGLDVILAWLKRLGVPVRDRADLAQDVLLRAVAAWSTYDPSLYARPPARPRRRFRGPGPLAPRQVFFRWMRAITRNTAINYFKAATRNPERLHPDPLPEHTLDESTPPPDAARERRDERARLAAALCLLSPLNRRLALGSIPRLAARLREPPSTLYKLRDRARAELAALLRGDPIAMRRGRVVALVVARRALRAHGLTGAEADKLLRAAAGGSYAAEVARLSRRGRALGLPPTIAGALAIAARASREALSAEGERARELWRLAVEAAEAALGRLGRAFGGS